MSINPDGFTGVSYTGKNKANGMRSEAELIRRSDCARRLLPSTAVGRRV